MLFKSRLVSITWASSSACWKL